MLAPLSCSSNAIYCRLLFFELLHRCDSTHECHPLMIERND